MSSDFDQMEEALLRVLRLSDHEQKSNYLAQLKPDIRREVESLLEAHVEVAQTAPPGLDRDLLVDVVEGTQNHELVREIGGYKILEVIGEGGMGIVYRAEQENPRRTIALKVIRPEFVSESTLKQFEYETT